MSRVTPEGAPVVILSMTPTTSLLQDPSTTNTTIRLVSTKVPKMAPTAKFFLPDDEETDTEGYYSENRDSTALSSSEVPRSLIVENYLTEQKTKTKFETEMFPPFVETTERMPEPTKVIKGFVPIGVTPLAAAKETAEKAKQKTYDPVPLGPGFPPPSNESYYLTSDGHDPKFARDTSKVIRTMPSRRKLSNFTGPVKLGGRLLEVAEDVSRRRDSLSSTGSTSTPTRSRESSATHSAISEGEKLARTVDWTRSGWGAPVPGAAKFFYPAEEQRADFVKVIDDYAKTPGPRRSGPHLLIPPVDYETLNVLEYCKKCDKYHIPPGSPITLPDRDTCGAYLPDWFPTQDYKQPWEHFRALYNKIVLCEEVERGFKHTSLSDHQPAKKVWDKEYHDEDPKWFTIGRRMGWWKCGTGTEVERNCELCHKPKPEGAEFVIDTENAGTVSDQRKFLEDWVEKQMRAVGLEDKAIAEEMIHRMKPQEVLGFFGEYRVQPEDLEGYDTGNDSDPDGEKLKKIPQQPDLKATDLPSGATLSTLDLSENGTYNDFNNGKVKMSEKEAVQGTPTSSSDCLFMRGRSFIPK